MVISKSVFTPLRNHEISSCDINESARKKNKKPNKNNSEEKTQKTFVSWARSNNLEIAHLNNGSGNKLSRIRLSAMGCSAGAADILVFDKIPEKPEIRGIALEFKTKTGKQSNSQKSWQKRIESLGWKYYIVRTFNEAKSILNAYGLPNRRNNGYRIQGKNFVSVEISNKRK